MKTYQANSDAILEVIGADHMLFQITSESIPNTKHSISLNICFCDCPSQKSTCKHILGIQLIVKQLFFCPQAKELLIGYVERMEHVDHLDDIVNLEINVLDEN